LRKREQKQAAHRQQARQDHSQRMHQSNGGTMSQGALGQRPQTHHLKREAKQKQGELMRESTRNTNREGK